MTSPLLSRRILGAVAFAVVFGVACYWLGTWQWSRYEDKDARANAIEANYHHDPVPLTSVLPATSSHLAEDEVWTRVTTTGEYAATTFHVRARTLDGVLGFEILVPLDVDGGATLLVDRGWLPASASADDLPTPPAAPTGEVTVVGWLKPGEPERTGGLPAGQLGSVDIDAAQAQVDESLYAAYLVLEQEQVPGGGTPERPTPLEPPPLDRGPHFAYALQWWLTAGLGIALVVYLYRSRPGPAQTGKATRRDRPPKPKKVRIWDEEDG
ncbi:MAG: hypothetical protein CSA84_01805 [Actinomycetales bacterium]|nr:MAG: hypothetical protein CSA84_01805 [Actinomycetales bacterium]